MKKPENQIHMYNVHVRIQKLYRIPSFKPRHYAIPYSCRMTHLVTEKPYMHTYTHSTHLFLPYVIIYPKLIMKIWHKRLHVTAQIYLRKHKLPTCVYTHLFNKHFHSSKTNTFYEIATWPLEFPNSDIKNIWLWTTYKLKLWENLQKHLAYTDHRIQFRKPKPWTLYELKVPGGCIRLLMER